MTLVRTVTKAAATAAATLACSAAMVTMASPANAEATDTQAPTVPAQVEFYYNYGCTWQWYVYSPGSSTDNVDDVWEIRYELYIDGELVAWDTAGGSFPGAQLPGTHTYTMRAIDTAGNASAFSQPVTRTF